MALSEITAFLCRCTICQHEWITRIAPARCAKCKARTWNQPQKKASKKASGTIVPARKKAPPPEKATVVPERFRALLEHIEKQKLVLHVVQPKRRFFNTDVINKSDVDPLLASLEAELEPMAPEIAAAIRHRREAQQIEFKNAAWTPYPVRVMGAIRQLEAVEKELRQGKPLPLEPHPRLLTEEEHRERQEKFNQFKREEAASVMAQIEARRKREAKRKRVAL